MIERELKCLVAGERNEQNSAYYLDFRYKDTPNWLLIHDLRIDHRGRVAQIDHLLINRFLDIFVLESKNYYYGVKISEEGEFLVWDGKTYQAIESPFEQNQRHILALQQAIDDRKLAPSRLGFAIPTICRNYILVAPTSKLIKPLTASFDLSTVVKADAFVSLVAGPGRQPGDFLYWPKESHQRKGLMALRSAFLLPAFRAFNGSCRNEPAYST